MRIEILVALISLGGVAVGASLSILGNYIQKRQERRAQLHKLLAEKRMWAYEEIIATAKFCATGILEVKENRYVKYPRIFSNAELYDQWYAGFSNIVQATSHLIDKRLAYHIYVFNNYIVNLNNVVAHFRGPDRQFKDGYQVAQLGALVYEDFHTLTNNIVDEAIKFFASGIYNDEFETSGPYEKDFDLPPSFLELALFKSDSDITRLLQNRHC